jgi:hypothetical protein
MTLVTIRVGVTGHRNLEFERSDALQTMTEVALDRIRCLFEPEGDATVVLTVVSALAEGADRLVARAVLGTQGGRLEAVLPFEEENYSKDFADEESKAAFLALCQRASVVVAGPDMEAGQVDDPDARARRYEWAGRYVVDDCDVLLALWDGQPSRGRGGTAETLLYALEQSTPILCILTEGATLVEYLGKGEIDEAFEATGIFDRSFKGGQRPH